MKTFKPTEAMIAAAETLFKAMAFESMIRDIVVKYQKEILVEGQWKVRAEFADRLGDDAVILDPKRSYLMSDSDFVQYNAKCKLARNQAKLHVENDEQCPLLVAEDMTRLARYALIEAMYDVNHVTLDMLLSAGMVKYEKYIDLTLKLLAPFVRNSKELLADVTA